MFQPNRLARILAVVTVAMALGVGGCTKRPSEEELAKLEEARMAAENAEQKLAQLRNERMQLERTLEEKQAELRRHEEERDELRMKMGQ